MKKIKILFILFWLGVLLISNKPANASDQLNIYFFYGDGCPHCAREEAFFKDLKIEMPEIEIKSYEVWKNRDNAKILSKIAKELNLEVSGVPLTIIGDQIFSGFYSAETTGKQIKEAVKGYVKGNCSDIVAPIFDSEEKNKCIHDCDQSDEECVHNCDCEADTIDSSNVPDYINIPIIGEIKTKNVSLPVLTILIAGLDGFNPCAMWVLLFLISLLLGIADRKKMWILGWTFIIISGLVYFLFLSAWLSLFLFLGFVFWIRIIIGLFALSSGGYHLKEYWTNRKGTCHVSEDKKRKKIFYKLKTIINNQNFWLALGGIMLLAGAVNLVELVCSAGLPAIYTQILSLSNLTTWQHYLYLLLYIFIFMLDDLLVFILAMSTLKMKAISSRYSRWSNLIGGIVMLIIGILLLFKPGWLMF